MIVVGLSHPISNNNAACVLVDGKLVAMAEEERFTRVKHAPRVFAEHALEYCMRQANIGFADVDFVAIGHGKPWSAIRNIGLGGMRVGINHACKQYLDLRRSQRKLQPLIQKLERSRIVYVRHHLAHAASAFFASGYKDANILTLDGSGDSESGILGYGCGAEMRILKRISNAASWGRAYEYITGTLGFAYNSEEGKTMGLAAYGTPDFSLIPFFDWDGDGDIPLIDYWKIIAFGDNTPERQLGEPLTDYHRNLAATMQAALEEAARIMSYWLYRRTGLERLCLAGGTCLNSSMNGRLLALPWIKQLFVQPASNDAGSALGAALFVHAAKSGEVSGWCMEHAYWGPEYANPEILAAIERVGGTRFRLCGDICGDTSMLIAQGKVVGWVQGRLEVGPRALGNRSILGHPSLRGMKDLINLKVKHREPWRPFAPAILDEAVERYVKPPVVSPFMILAVPTSPEKRNEIASAVHVDGTARFQTVSRKTNPRFWELIKRFEDITGIPAVLNTSFNVSRQPIVNTPEEAIRTFLECGMDCLAVGDYLLERE